MDLSAPLSQRPARRGRAPASCDDLGGLRAAARFSADDLSGPAAAAARRRLLRGAAFLRLRRVRASAATAAARIYQQYYYVEDDDWRDLPPPPPPVDVGFLPVLAIGIPLVVGAVGFQHYEHYHRDGVAPAGLPRFRPPPPAPPPLPRNVNPVQPPPPVPVRVTGPASGHVKPLPPIGPPAGPAAKPAAAPPPAPSPEGKTPAGTPAVTAPPAESPPARSPLLPAQSRCQLRLRWASRLRLRRARLLHCPAPGGDAGRKAAGCGHRSSRRKAAAGRAQHRDSLVGSSGNAS